MAEIAGSFLGPVIEVVKWVGAPIKRQFNYLCCFTSNISSLKNEAETLQPKAEDLQSRADEETNNGRVIFKEVVNLLESSKNTIEEVDGILNEAPNVESGCLKLRARYSLSKRAKKKSDHLKDLQGEYNQFDTPAIAFAGPTTAMQPVPTNTTYKLESRKQIEEDIMTTLKLGVVNTMGICGMGGLGKTTMAITIMNRALEEHVFEEVVMAVIRQTVDKLNIQVEIGGTLGLKLEGETYQSRLQKLHARLSGTKRILLVLDDVWERLDLGDLGIPCNHKGCTILLTSRNRDTLSAMNVEKVFGMDVLSKEDAWFLFRKIAGSCVDNTNLNLIAKEVVDECQGLTLALIIVGGVLREKMDASTWTDALSQLRKSDPDIPKLITDIYNPLRLSYDVLGPKHKFVFLLCCLYPEDAHIPLEHLTYFCMGLGVFEGGVEEARNKMHALTKFLKSQSLLLDSERGDNYVRMHDVVRDVCIFIAKEEKCIGGNDCSWISSTQRTELTSGLTSQNLRLIFWRRSYSENEDSSFLPFPIPISSRKFVPNTFQNLKETIDVYVYEDSSFLGDINDLYVLCIEAKIFTSLPFTTQSWRNLKTLVVDSCFRLETLSSIGGLVSLEILVCHSCGSIGELPQEMERLTRLKVLDLTDCKNLERIGRGIISSLVELEELKMLGSFKKWEAEDREVRENAGLKELEALTKLRCLEIEIENTALVVENMQLSSKLDRFNIILSHEMQYFHFDWFSKKLHLCWEEESRLGDWIEVWILREAEYLLLTGNGANNVDLAKSENIKVLELGKCENMEKMATTSMDDGGASIEYLRLFDLPKLEIMDGPIWWLNLKVLLLINLPTLKQLCKSSSLHLEKDYFPQLETLRIERCWEMEQVFKWDESENISSHHITKMLLPKLKYVTLEYLPNLISFGHGIQGIEFPQLSTLSVKKCGNFNWMVSEGNDNNSGGGGSSSSSNAHIHHPHPSSQPQEVSLGCVKEVVTDWNPFGGHKIHVSVYNGLEVLEIGEFKGSMSLFSSSIIGALVNLRKLLIKDCNEMVKVIEDEEEVVSTGGERAPLSLFPKLQELILFGLPELVSFCEWKCDVELPSLRKLMIRQCDNMKNVTLGTLTAPNLTIVKIGHACTKDLKDALQQWCA